MKLRATGVLVIAAFLVITCPAWAAPSICDAVPGNLVFNCGFETGDFTGWAVTGNTGFTGVGTFANSGTFAAYLGPVGSDGFLTQFVGDNSTIYYVSFYLYNTGGTPNDFTVYWNGVDVGPDLLNVNGFPYTQFSRYLAGNSGIGSNQLTFGYRQDPSYWWLDDVVVTNTPEPGTMILMGSGLVGLAGVIRRKLGM